MIPQGCAPDVERRLSAMLAAASSAPAAPPQPTFVDATASVLRVQLMFPPWAAGRPVPTHFDVNYCKKVALTWDEVPFPIATHLLPRAHGSAATTAAGVGGAGGKDTSGDASSAQPSRTGSFSDSKGGDGEESEASSVVAPSGEPAGDDSASAAAVAAAVTEVHGGRRDSFSEDKGGDEAAYVMVDIPNLNADTKYMVRVRLRNKVGWGQWSAKSEEFSTGSATDRRVLPVLPDAVPQGPAVMSPEASVTATDGAHGLHRTMQRCVQSVCVASMVFVLFGCPCRARGKRGRGGLPCSVSSTRA